MITVPAPSLPTGSATSSRACSPAMCSFGRSATALGLSAVSRGGTPILARCHAGAFTKRSCEVCLR